MYFTSPCVFAYHQTWCPVLRDTFFWTPCCALRLTDTSASGAARGFLGWTCSTVWPSGRVKRPCPQTCLTLSFHFSPGTPAMLWQPCLQPGGWPLFRPGHQGLWHSAAGQSVWGSTTPSASKLTLERTNSKAWGRYKLTLHSSAKKLPQGLGLAWKLLVYGRSKGRPVSEVATELRWAMIPGKMPPDGLLKKIHTPMIPGSLQQAYFLKNRWGALNCARIAHRSGTGVLPGNPHAFITPQGQNHAGSLPDVSMSSENFWPASKNTSQFFF